MINNAHIFLVFHGQFPGEKAAALFAAHSVAAFQGNGAETTLLVPRRFGRSKLSANEYYKLGSPIQIEFLPVIDVFKVPVARHVAFWISYVTFSISVCLYILFRVPRNSIVYSNEALTALLATFVHRSVVYELHDFPERSLLMYKILLKRVSKIITTNNWKKEKLIDRFQVPEEKIIVELNAVDIDQFDPVESQVEARTALGLPQNEIIVLYTGHLYGWKGADILAEAAKEIPEYLVYFVGGVDPHLQKFKDKYAHVDNLRIIGHRPHAEIPLWQRSADVLVLPNSGKEDISRYYTSPMKLFEYMASGTPVVASRLPSIEEIVSDDEIVFVDPDSTKELSEGIVLAMSDLDISDKKANSAHEQVLSHTWKARAQRIIKIL